MTSAASSTETETLRVGDDLMAVHAPSAASGGALLAYDVTLSPGGGPPHLHRHAAAELLRVEEGELTFYLAEEDGTVDRRTAGPGEVVAIAGNREHGFRNETAAAARAFAVLAPGEGMEHFARAAAALGAAASPERVAALAAANGIEITRPLPPEPGQEAR
jgi:quercetin dioxygenase-like cupin family protein